MEYGAIDLHTRRSQVLIVREDGAVVLERRIDTTRDAFDRVFASRPRMRILLESSTESEWVASYLEQQGHDVVIADPNYLPMYAARSRRVKTDRRDAAALADACRRGIYRPAHRASRHARTLRQTLRARRHVVHMRSSTISVIRSILRHEGIRIPSGAARHFVQRLDRLAVPETVAVVLAPLRVLLSELTTLIAAADKAVTMRATAEPVTQRLMTTPGVGPVLALTFQAVIDDPSRFHADAGRVSAYLGLVPSEHSSAERRQRSAITKAGSRELRMLLVQGAWAIWRNRGRPADALRTWVQTLAARRGRRIAIVALARRLSRILFALWRDNTDFRWTSVASAA